tara:strand:- start:805 stop:2442 length:1638 start_codon:yes stop_codon:yes gene_type:complete
VVSLIGATQDGKEVCLTARQLEAAIGAVAHQLEQSGVSHLGLLGHNSPDWLVAQLAAWRAGLPVTPIPAFFSEQQINHLLDTTGLDGLLLVQDDSLDAWLPSARANDFKRQPLSTGDSPDGLSIALFRRRSTPAPLPDGTRLITFTSGTTGTPKGVCLSGPHLESVIEGLEQRLAGVPLHRHGVVLPLAVLLEHLAGALFALWRGAQIIVDAPLRTGLAGSGDLNPLQWRDWLETRRPDSLILVPALLKALCDLGGLGGLGGLDRSSGLDSQASRPSDWQQALSLVAVGGGQVPRYLLDQATQLGLPVAQGYGMSEMGSVVCLSRPDEPQDGRVGRPLKGLRLSTDEQGQLLVHGRRMLGYLTSYHDGPSSDMPWPSGDLGHRLADDHWRLDGRQRNVIILSSGRNLCPEWLEAELELIDGIDRAFIFGEGLPGVLALLGPSAIIQPPRLEAHIAALNQRLPDYARVRGWQSLMRQLPGVAQPLSIASNELTANGRLRRASIYLRRRRDIERLVASTFPGHQYVSAALSSSTDSSSSYPQDPSRP